MHMIMRYFRESMELFPLVGLSGLLGLVYLVFTYYRFVARFPKGPTPLPFIGNMLSVKGTTMHEDLWRMAQTHGPVFTVFIPIPIVVMSNYEAVKEAFIENADDFSGRPTEALDDEFIFCKNPGVINSNGESWRENRRAAISILRDFGMGKGLMEEQVKQSLSEFMRCLDDIEDKSRVDMRWSIQLYVANIINETLFGYRYKYDDCEPLVNYVEAFNRLIREASASMLRFIAFKLRWIRHVPILGYYAVKRFLPDNYIILNYISTNVNRALSEDDGIAEPSCFVHAYSRKIGTSPHLNNDQLKATCFDFFLAGQETTTTTLRWAVLFLADNQEAQEKIRQEVLSVVGSDRLPSMADKPNLPYTSAAIHEIQRRGNVLMFNVMRRTTADTEIMGIRIPKDTFVNGDIHMIMEHDPIFAESHKFMPERYLSDDGKSLRKDVVERTVPFSIGKRQCAGEGMARVELFLGVAGLLQRYRILPSSDQPVDLEPEAFLFMLPKTQHVRLERVIA